MPNKEALTVDEKLAKLSPAEREMLDNEKFFILQPNSQVFMTQEEFDKLNLKVNKADYFKDKRK